MLSMEGWINSVVEIKKDEHTAQSNASRISRSYDGHFTICRHHDI